MSMDCQDSDDCQAALPVARAKAPRAKQSKESRTNNHLVKILQAMGHRRNTGTARNVSYQVRWLVQHMGLLCDSLPADDAASGFVRDLHVFYDGLQALGERPDVKRRDYPEEWKAAVLSLSSPEGYSFLQAASVAAGFHAQATEKAAETPAFETLEEATQEIHRLRRVVKRMKKEARGVTTKAAGARPPSAGPAMLDAENLLSLSESPAASRTHDAVVDPVDCQALVVHDFRPASPAAPAAASPVAPVAPAAVPPVAPALNAEARATMVPPSWTLIEDLHAKLDKLPRPAQERLAYALFANQELTVALDGVVKGVALSNGKGRLPMAAKSVLIKAIVRLDPPPPPGMIVRLKMTVHDGTNGEQLSPAALKGNPAFENVAYGDSDTVYDAVGETGTCTIEARLGFTGQLTTYHNTEVPFFLRVQVADGAVPVFGDSPNFMVHARKKGDGEMANREAAYGGAHPRAESDDDAPPPPAKRQAKAPKAPAPKAKAAAAPKAQAPARAPTVLDRVPKRRAAGDFSFSGVLARMELPVPKAPVRAPEPAPVSTLGDEGASGRASPWLGEDVGVAFAAIMRKEEEEAAAQEAEEGPWRLGGPTAAPAAPPLMRLPSAAAP